MSEAPPPPSSPLNYATPAGYSGAAPSKEECNMAMLIYILSIFTGFIGPLIIWLMKKDTSPFINDQGKECLNWCITFVICYIVSIILMFVIIGIFLMFALLILNLVFAIMGAIKSSKGIAYRYPFAIRLIK